VKLAPDAAERLLKALDLQQAGLMIMHENLVRRSPGATDQEINDAFQTWLEGSAGYEAGDPDVVVGTWPRRR
jgi:hypothetical protein